MTALFIAVEGPNGVGKTTIADRLARRLTERDGLRVRLTTEPTRTQLGELLRSAEAGLSGRPFALALAADRYLHLEREILPELERGVHVVTDRYVQSSLVLQRIDGLALPEVWLYNQHVLPPTLTIYLEHDPDEIRQRLFARTAKSRLELAGSPERELQLYRDAYEFLAGLGWQQARIDCRNLDPDAIVGQALQILDNRLS